MNKEEKYNEVGNEEEYCDLFDYILEEENNFKTQKVPLGTNWEWNMHDHLDKSFLLKNSKFIQGDNDSYTRIFKQIILPILNVAYRTEGFNVKDVELFVEDKDYYHLSLIARKFHKKYAIDNQLDKAIDDSVTSYVDYGLMLIKDVKDKKPNIVDLLTLAFCDQSDIEAGPICIKHNYSVEKLQEMKGKWNNEAIDSLVRQASFDRKINNRTVKTPHKSVEVYELHGVFPKSWRTDNHDDEYTYERQLFIVAYYKDSKDHKKGVRLYRGKIDNVFMSLKRDDISGRARGSGGSEELMNEQVWTNYSMIQIKELLDMLALFVFKTDDKDLAQRTTTKDLKKGTILELKEGKDFGMVQSTTPNVTAFETFTQLLEQNARTIGSASDPQLGLNPVSGTPLGTTQIVTAQGGGIHEYRKKQIQDFWTLVYQNIIIEHIQQDLEKGDEWLEELSLDELREVSDKLSINEANDRIKKGLIEGKVITKEGQDELISLIKEDFLKGGKRKFMEVLKDEFKEMPIKVRVNIGNVMEDFPNEVSKLNNILTLAFQNAQALQNPVIAELLNRILEKSGLNPLDFTSLTKGDIIKEGTNQNIPLNTQNSPPEMSDMTSVVNNLQTNKA